ncbi:MAG TPA: hypothetical protein VM187_03305, partial [Niastella sp.]|nr:hypothetical protein [Niastella sp.]
CLQNAAQLLQNPYLYRGKFCGLIPHAKLLCMVDRITTALPFAFARPAMHTTVAGIGAVIVKVFRV